MDKTIDKYMHGEGNVIVNPLFNLTVDIIINRFCNNDNDDKDDDYTDEKENWCDYNVDSNNDVDDDNNMIETNIMRRRMVIIINTM